MKTKTEIMNYFIKNVIINTMKNIKKINSLILLVIFSFAILFVFYKSTKAQQANPEFLFSWQPTNSYAPSFFTGKILPNAQSQIAATFELISNGKPINLSNENIYWYLNNNLIGSGVGMQQLTFPLFGMPPQMENLRIELPDYSTGYLIYTTNLPFMRPSAIISAPYYNNIINGSDATITALAYYFNDNQNNLIYNWSVNGQSGSSAENPNILHITIPTGSAENSTMAISLQIENINGNENVNNSLNLIYK
jgi:hypothetical protein